jgi:hypothetical protein
VWPITRTRIRTGPTRTATPITATGPIIILPTDHRSITLLPGQCGIRISPWASGISITGTTVAITDILITAADIEG